MRNTSRGVPSPDLGVVPLVVHSLWKTLSTVGDKDVDKYLAQRVDKRPNKVLNTPMEMGEGVNMKKTITAEWQCPECEETLAYTGDDSGPTAYQPFVKSFDDRAWEAFEAAGWKNFGSWQNCPDCESA